MQNVFYVIDWTVGVGDPSLTQMNMRQDVDIFYFQEDVAVECLYLQQWPFDC